MGWQDAPLASGAPPSVTPAWQQAPLVAPPPAAPKQDATGAANAAANATPERLPGVSDVVDAIKNAPHYIPAILQSIAGRVKDLAIDPQGTMANDLMHASRVVGDAVSNPAATAAQVGSTLRNATGAKEGAQALANLGVGAGIGGLAGAARGLTGASEAAATEAASPAGKLGLSTTEPHPIARNVVGVGDLPQRNQVAAEAALGAEAGVPHGTDVTHGSLNDAATAPGDFLNHAATQTPTVPLSAGAAAQIRAARPPQSLLPGNPDLDRYVNQTEQNLLGTPETGGAPQLTADQVRATRNEASQAANVNRLSDKPENRQLGDYQRAVANAMDQHVADTLPPNSAISPQQIANARQTLAKNYQLRDLIGPGGDIDLQKLAQIHRDNPNLLTGDTRVVAQFAHDHPEVTSGISDADRAAPPGVVQDIMSVNPLKPIKSLAQLFGGWAARGAMRTPLPGPLTRTPVAGLGGEFDERPINGLAPPPGAIGEAPERQGQLPLTPPNTPMGPTTLPPREPPGPPSAVPPKIARDTARNAPGQPPLALADSFPGTPAGNNADVPGVMSQGVPEGIVQKSRPPFKPAPGDMVGGTNPAAKSGNTPEQHNAIITQGIIDTIDKLHAKLAANPGTVVPGAMHKIYQHLAANLDPGTDEGKFFKNIYSSLAAQNLNTHLELPSLKTGLGSAFGKAMSYQSGKTGMALNDLTVDPHITMAHEGVHAATMSALNDNTQLQGGLRNLMMQAQKSPAVRALSKQDQYGVTATDAFGRPNPQEVWAESQSNPRFQQALRDSPSAAQPGKSLYDDLKKMVGTSLGLPPTAYNHPLFDQVLSGQAA